MFNLVHPSTLPLLLVLPLLPPLARADLPYNPVGDAFDQVGSNSHVQGVKSDFDYGGSKIKSFGTSLGSRIKTAGPVTGLSADAHYIHTNVAAAWHSFESGHPHINPAYDWTQLKSWYSDASTISDPEERSSLMSQLQSYSSVHAAQTSNGGAIGPAGASTSNGAGTGATPAATPMTPQPMITTVVAPPTTVTTSVCPETSSSISTSSRPLITPMPPPVMTPTPAATPAAMYTGLAAPRAGVNAGAMLGLAGFLGFLGFL
ncbi:MAG: hypothetical protein Q9162_002940 [Coniocarpon cinnabarinum]